MRSWLRHIMDYYDLVPPPLPDETEWLYPQRDPAVLNIMRGFYGLYYSDDRNRRILLGINPGRFGAGVTGVNFTAPKQLAACGISHPFRMHSELSAEFFHAMMEAYGGVDIFCGRYFTGSVCPLGFTRNGRNLNYYDSPRLMDAVTPFITESITRLVSFRTDKSICYCIGGDRNFRFLTRQNEIHGWFEKIISLPHPRFIMQYRRKDIKQYIRLYLDALEQEET